MDDAAPDHELLVAWRAGDRAAGRRLFDRYYEAVARFFLNKAGDAAGELVQRTFLACVEGAARLRDDGKFRSYLFAVAYRQLCRHYQERHGAAVDLAASSVAALGASPSEAMAAREEQRLLLAGLRELPIECQVALELHYWEEMTTAEIAEVLEIPEGTVKSRLRRGRELLRAAIVRLAASPALAESTLGGLDAWASRLRREIARGKKSPPS